MKAQESVDSSVPFEEAGQTEDLVARLRGLIRDYPDGVGIVKELLQNADDAGATWVRFTLDLRRHGTGALPTPTMARLVAPALLVESDQSFTDQDLHDIQRIGNAGKAREGGKTGRFGLGFNTVYNITDYPAFATRDLIMCFDPHRDVVARGGGRPGALWRLDRLQGAAPDWPLAFGLAPGTTHMERRTIFRLPLRTPEQCGEHRIASQPFPPDRVERLFSELESWGSSLLIFLRSVQRISAEILHADKPAESRIDIQTINGDEVAAARTRISRAREGTMEDLLAQWAELNDGPREVYHHSFLVRTYSTERAEDWCISQGLFFGKDRELLAVAAAMNVIKERAVPLAGAAVRVSGAGTGPLVPEAIAGRLFCTLPLPDTAAIPFHINAFFDLDSSRSRITHGHAVGDAAIRVSWNDALLRYALPESVALVFAYIKDRIPDTRVHEYYDLWPDPRKLRTPMERFAELLYRRLAELPLFRARQGGETIWVDAQQIRLPANWSNELIKALKDDGMELPEPNVPAHLVQGFDVAGSRLQRWTPAQLRDWLRVTQDSQSDIADAPRACLRTRDTLVELLRFCVTGERATLDGLPLALMSDGKLRAFNRGSEIFIANAAIRDLFRARSSWFLDPHLESAVPELPLGSGLTRMDETRAIVQLKTHLHAQNEGRPWRPNGSDIPNSLWLGDLFRWLATLPPRAKRAEELTLLALVPDDSDRLWRPGLTSTPLLPDDGLARELRSALAEFGVPLVGGTPELMASIRLFAARHDGMIWGITAADVIDTLGTLATSTHPGSSVAANATSRIKLLTWLAEQDVAAPLDPQRLTALGRMAIWPTEDQQIVTTEGAFLPTGFQAPAIASRVTLLDPGGSSGTWRRLLSRIGVDELDIAAFVTKSLLPSYGFFDDASKRAALGWLRDHGWAAIHADTTPQAVRDALKRAHLVRGSDKEWYRASELYHPEFGIEKILGPLARIPDTAEMYRNEPRVWLEFFDALGMRRHPREQDIVARIDQLIATPSDESAQEALCVILQHLDDRWERFSEETRKRLVNELRKRAWIPALLEPPEGAAGFTRPASPLALPLEVYPQRLVHLVSSQAPLLRLPSELKREFREALGMPGDARLEVAVAHFTRIREVWDSSDPPRQRDVSQESVGKTADATMRLLGRHLGARTSVEKTGLRRALDQLRDTPCIWDTQRGRFWHPRHVFAEPVPYFGDLRSSMASDPAVASVLEALGGRRRPTSEDIVDFLEELAQICADKPLTPQQVAMVTGAWRELERLGYELSSGSDPPVLTTSNRLRPMSAALVDDAPWWRERLHAADLPWVYANMVLFVTALGAPRASKEVLEEVVERGTHPPLTLVELCERHEAHLKSEAFLAGLARLVIHECGGLLDTDSLRERVALRVVACERLRSCLRCPVFDIHEAVGEADVPCLLEEGSWGAQIYVATADEDELIPALADALNRRLADKALRNLAPLEDIIRCSAERVHSKLDLRKIPRLPEATAPYPPDDVESTYESDGLGDDRSIEKSDDDDSQVPEGTEGTKSATGYGLPYERSGSAGRVPRPSPAQPWSAPSSDRPPTTPHEGERANTSGRSSGRARSYAETPSPDGLPSGEASENSRRVKNAALDIIEAEETKRNCKVVRVTNRSQGYDMEISEPTEDSNRLVEVKGLDERWDRRGVALSPDELRVAQREGERYWLYVVEYASDPMRATVYRIQDPAGKVHEFRFDDGWRCFSRLPVSEPPAEGRVLLDLAGTPIGLILKVIARGVATRLELELPDGAVRHVTYNAETHRIARGNQNGTSNS